MGDKVNGEGVRKEAGKAVVCRICEKAIPTESLEEHSFYCQIVSKCLADIETCNDLFATAAASAERRLNQLPSVGATDAQSVEQGTMMKVTEVCKAGIGLDQADDIPATVGPFFTLRDLLVADHFQATMLSSVLDSLEEKAKALQKIRHYLTTTSAPFLSLPSEKVRQPRLEDFTILKTLSRGSFGKVFLVKKEATRDYYALKVLQKKDLSRKNQLDHVLNERKLLAMINSPFVVKLFYSFQTMDSLYMVMEYANGGDVNMLLTSVGVLTEAWARFYTAELVLALEHIHSLGIVHRDIKPDNLLITATGHIKLTDFGLSRDGVLPRYGRPDNQDDPGNDHDNPAEVLDFPLMLCLFLFFCFCLNEFSFFFFFFFFFCYRETWSSCGTSSPHSNSATTVASRG